MDMNSTQPIHPEISAFGRKLWKAARRVTVLEYENKKLRDREEQLTEIIKELTISICDSRFSREQIKVEFGEEENAL